MGYLYEIAKQIQIMKLKADITKFNLDVNEEMSEDDWSKSDKDLPCTDNRHLDSEKS